MDALIYKLIHNCQLLSTVLKYLKYALSCDRGGGYSLLWPLRGRAAVKGMVSGVSVLIRVYTFM